MVLIPNDAGIRMRLHADAPAVPVTPIAEIPADLIDLHPGQAFSARIQEVLPENTYKAIVAGRSLTLSLPEGAKAGDTLELVVIDRTPRLIVAQLAGRASAGETAANASYSFATLSRTAQVIGALLARDGNAPPAELNGGRPLLPLPTSGPAQLAADLAPQLARAVGASGLFYEAHQVQWAMGQRPVSDLLAEPQARHAATSTGLPASAPETGHTARPANAGRAELPGPMVLLKNLFGGEETRHEPAAPNPAATSPAQAVPEELRPLVQQQLDAAATLRLAWHGEVWPGQRMDWQIEPEDQASDRGAEDGARGWVTSLRLTTPRLGSIDARLTLTSQGVRILVATPIGATAADLLDAAPALETSMAAAGVPLLAFQVKHDAGA